MFWVWWNTELPSSGRYKGLWTLSECHKTYPSNLEPILYQQNKTLSHSWVRCWTNTARSVESWTFPFSWNRWLIQGFWVVLLTCLFLINHYVTADILPATCLSNTRVYMRVQETVYTLIFAMWTQFLKHTHKKLSQPSNAVTIPAWYSFVFCLSSLFHMRAHTHTNSHTAVFYLPGSSRRWWYSVNFNTRILDILYGCELPSNSNRCFASALCAFLPAGHCHRRSPRKPLLMCTGCYCPLLGTATLFCTALNGFGSRLYTESSTLELCQHILPFMMGPVVASSLLNVKGMLIKWCSTPANCWNQEAKNIQYICELVRDLQWYLYAGMHLIRVSMGIWHFNFMLFMIF